MEEYDDILFLDIDMKIFHNTYGNFPTVPDILNDKVIKDRFFYASMGWIGRNPFLNHLKKLDPNCAYEHEHKHLLKGAKAVAEHLQDSRFLALDKAHDLAYEHLDEMKKEFEVFSKSWTEMMRRIV